MNIEKYLRKIIKQVNDPAEGSPDWTFKYIEYTMRFSLADSAERTKIFYVSKIVRDTCFFLSMELNTVHLALKLLHQSYER